MLVSKGAITRELSGRIAEFAPPGEQYQAMFEAEYGMTPFLNPIGTPLFIVLTTNYVVLIGAKKMTNAPTSTLGVIPRPSIRFTPPDNGIAHLWVTAEMRDAEGQGHGLRLKIHKMWREEATALCNAANAPAPPGPGQPFPQQPQQPNAYPAYPPPPQPPQPAGYPQQQYQPQPPPPQYPPQQPQVGYSLPPTPPTPPAPRGYGRQPDSADHPPQPGNPYPPPPQQG